MDQRKLFRRRANKESTECDSTDKHPRTEIPQFILHQTLLVSHLLLCQQHPEADLVHTNRHCLTDTTRKHIGGYVY